MARNGTPDPLYNVECVLCGSTFQMGNGLYAGTYVPRYEMNVCSPCYAGNHDGYASHFEDNILKHLKAIGLEVPKRNAKGYIPCD